MGVVPTKILSNYKGKGGYDSSGGGSGSEFYRW